MFPPDLYDFGMRLVICAVAICAAVYGVRVILTVYRAVGG